MLGTYANLETAKDDFYRQCTMADFWIDIKKAPVAQAKNLSTLPGIAEISQRIVFPVIVDLEKVAQPISGQAVSIPDVQRPGINSIVLRSGSYFSGDERDEVILSEKFAQARDLQPGMSIHLILNGQRKKLMIVGTAISAEHVYLAPPGGFMSDPGNYGLFYLKQTFAEDIFGFEGACNSIVGTFTPYGKKQEQTLFLRMTKNLDPFGVFAITPLKDQFSNLSLNSEMGGLKTLSTMLPIMFLSVAALVLNVLMTRMAKQQRTIIGTLKALGYFNREILYHFLKFGLTVGILGALAGCALGYWMSGGMNSMYKAFFSFPRLLNYAYPAVMILAVIISLIFAALGTIRGVRCVIRLNPAESMREAAPETAGAIILERLTSFWQSLSLWWQIILRGMFRNKTKTLIGIFAAVMGSALVLLSFGFTNSMNYMVDFQFSKVLISNFDIGLKDGVDDKAVAEILRLPGVTHAEPVFTVPCTFYNDNHHKKGAISGLVQGAALTVPRTGDGTAVDIPTAGLLMTRRLANELDLDEGDYVRFVPIKGIKQPHTVQISRIIDSMLGLSVYADSTWLITLLGEGNIVSQIQLQARQTHEQQQSFYKTLKTFPLLESVSSIEEQKQTIQEQMTQSMGSVAFIMVLFAGVIFFGSILNASLISLSERQREISTYRVLGYQPREIGGMFLRENLLINMVGALLGLPVGKWMLIGMMTQYSNDAYSMPAIVTASSWGWTLLLSVIFVLGAHFFVQKNINKLNWLEGVNYKE